MLQIKSISKRYKTGDFVQQALDKVSLNLRDSEFVAILGPSGSGKTTLLNIIGGLDRYDDGDLVINGISTRQYKDRDWDSYRNHTIGFVFQSYNLIPHQTILSNVELALTISGIGKADRRERARKALEKVGLGEHINKKPNQLSGGQMQRVAIASVLVMRPDVMILDEPTSQLDPEGSDEVFKAVETLTGSGITILMIEQKIEKLAAYCDRILLLHKGKQIAFDTPQKVFSMPDLNNYGIQAPAFTRICKAEGVTLADGTYPVTVEEAAGVLREKRLGAPACADGKERAQRAAGAELAQAGGPSELAVSSDEQFCIKNLDFSYLADVPVLKKLNMKLDKCPTAIIGQNGAGKTTLVKLLKGLLKPVSGSIYFHGEDISGKTVAMLAGNVGYVFQNPDDQIFKYNVMDEILFGPLNIGMDAERAKKEAERALKLTGLTGKEKENPYDLELYERKMTAIASVLAMDTDVLVLDEPTIAQDWKGRQIIGDIIRSLSERGKLVIAILHDMDFVAENFERVIIMAHGQVLADGTAKEVFAQEEALKKARLQKPYVMQLCEALGYEKSYLTVEELLKDQVS